MKAGSFFLGALAATAIIAGIKYRKPIANGVKKLFSTADEKSTSETKSAEAKEPEAKSAE